MAGEITGQPVIVTLPDEIDVTNSGAAAATLLGARDNPGLIIADMTGTTFCDSSGMRMLIVARDRAEAGGSTLRIVITPDGSVARMMAILGVGSVLPVHTSVHDAMTAQAEASRPALRLIPSADHQQAGSPCASSRARNFPGGPSARPDVALRADEAGRVTCTQDSRR